jgi:hypothetical protein
MLLNRKLRLWKSGRSEEKTFDYSSIARARKNKTIFSRFTDVVARICIRNYSYQVAELEEDY